MPIATVGQARDDICAFFKAVWDTLPVGRPVVLYDDDKADDPHAGTPFVRFSVQHNTSQSATVGGGIGNRRSRQYGIATAQVFTVLGDGLKKADTYSNLLVTAFRNGKTGEDAITFRSAVSREIGRSNAWFQTNVIIEFDYDSVQ